MVKAREWCINLIVAVFFGNFAHKFILHWLETGLVTSLLFAVIEGMLVLVFLFRRLPNDVSFRFYDWFIAIVGTCMFMVVEPQGGRETLLGKAVMSIGLLLTVAAIVSLNRSFGVVAANRGIKREGLYRFIRHPLYAAYFMIIASFLLNYPSRFNFVIAAIHTGVQILRIYSEERFLMRDPEYQAYAGCTRYRLVPFIW